MNKLIVNKNEATIKATLFIVTGPTASGKSEFALALAERIGGEIVSADSMQVYKGFNIGTAKPDARTLKRVPHRMIDVCEPDAGFSVSDFKRGADAAIADITGRGKTPIVAGGTGLYIRALLYESSLGACEGSEQVRGKYLALFKENGAEFLHNLLEKTDAASAARIHTNDTKRVIRALEIYELSGKKKSEITDAPDKRRYNFTAVRLDMPRDKLYERINRRVDKMISAGLIEEVRTLYRYKNCQSMQAIGYKELIAYLDNRLTLGEAVDKIKQSTRNYAKRQITYLNGLKDIKPVDNTVKTEELLRLFYDA